MKAQKKRSWLDGVLLWLQRVALDWLLAPWKGHVCFFPCIFRFGIWRHQLGLALRVHCGRLDDEKVHLGGDLKIGYRVGLSSNTERH